ncbi:MAG: LysR substrate-binding domain-containing protein [Moraxella sp.]|nr:LysR substrate-binding domain-containing protein [Moraxella sp.]
MSQLSVRRFPSTTALQCFECTARHLSFTRASKELHMTQSAVSKQVAQLEELLSVQLFYRASSGLFLSPAGKAYYHDTLAILQQLENATLNLMAHGVEADTLKIASHSTFCANWLIPALKGFGDAHPLIHLDICEQVSTLLSDEIDMGFLYGDGVWADKEAVKLFDECCIAVCAPHYLHQINNLEVLANSKLIQLRTRPRAWVEYFYAQGYPNDKALVGVRFDTFNACINAAKIGCGVALVPTIFVNEQLKSGELVQVHPYQMMGSGAYFMAYQSRLGNTKKVQTMIEWILAYIRAS